MSIFFTEKTEIDFSFQPIDEGDYVLEICEGINIYTNEEKGTVSLSLPIKTIEVIQGNNPGTEESLNKKFNYFCSLTHPKGIEQLIIIISNCGLSQKFAEKFNDDVDFAGSQFITMVKMLLPEKLICGETFNKKSKGDDGKEYTNTNIVRLWKNEKKKAVKTDQEVVEGWS